MTTRVPTPEEVNALVGEALRALTSQADNEYASGVFDALSWLAGTGERPDVESDPPERTPTRQRKDIR